MATSPSFYVLEPSWATRYLWASVDDKSLAEVGDMGYRELAHFKGQVSLSVVKGAEAGDFIWNGLGLLVVSDHLLEVLRLHHVGGYATYEVQVKHSGHRLPGYHGLAITGMGGKNHPSAFKDGLIPGTAIQRVKGLHPTSWDGADLFTLDDAYRIVLATERVRRIFQDERITNCKFKPAAEFSIGY